jgi:hypothetical protein
MGKKEKKVDSEKREKGGKKKKRGQEKKGAGLARLNPFWIQAQKKDIKQQLSPTPLTSMPCFVLSFYYRFVLFSVG